MNPYKDSEKTEESWIREFSVQTSASELVWHRDHNDRVVTVLSGDGWSFQMDNEVPKPLNPGDRLEIPKGVWHRLYQTGSSPLKIEIKENVSLK